MESGSTFAHFVEREFPEVARWRHFMHGIPVAVAKW
jgi:hypothetical protein